ncbi:MAG: alpha/beta hydrolase [Pseudomonadota bacterium]
MRSKLGPKIRQLISPQTRDEFENNHQLIKLWLKQPESDRPPILLVPGSFSGAWIWKGNFLEFFHQAGFEVAAMSFGGHGMRGPMLWKRGLKEFENDLIDTIMQFDKPPILIAHSLGGLIAQRVALKVPIAGLALLAPIPLHGVLPSGLSLSKKSKGSLFKLAAIAFEPRLSRTASAPIGVYSANVDRATQKQITGRLQAESPTVLLQSLLPASSKYSKIPCPTKFWGAEGDEIIPSSEVLRAANTLGVEATIFPGLSHTYQAEPEWPLVAKNIKEWLEENVIASNHVST